ARTRGEEELLESLDRMAPGSRYSRFMATIREPNVKRLREVLASFPERGMAIIATVPAPDGIDIVGSASFMLEAPGECEFAISVGDAWGGAGLGRALM